MFAVGFISFASGLVRERRSAYEAAVMCSKAGSNAAMVSQMGSDEDLAAILEDACIYLRVTYLTLISSGHVSMMFVLLIFISNSYRK